MLHQMVGRDEFSAREGKVGAGGVLQRIAQYGESRTERMRQVADMAARPLHRCTVLRHQRIDLSHQRQYLRGSGQV
jgi:hypothetical protein